MNDRDRLAAGLAHGFAMKYGLIAQMTHEQAAALDDALRIYLTGAFYIVPPLDEERLARALIPHTRQFTDGSWLLVFDASGYPHPTIEAFAAAIAKAYREDKG